MGVQLVGTPGICESCNLGKACQKGVPKEKVERSKIVSERFFIDISSPQEQSVGGS